jgi:hypothetical protein
MGSIMSCHTADVKHEILNNGNLTAGSFELLKGHVYVSVSHSLGPEPIQCFALGITDRSEDLM